MKVSDEQLDYFISEITDDAMLRARAASPAVEAKGGE